MMLRFDTQQIENLMKSFYTLSGMRFVLFDSEFNEVISYPKESCDFCKIMKNCPKTRRKCNLADRRSFEKCEKENALVLYKCHAGLVEAVMPLHENEKIAGFLMFGQITDNSDKSSLYANIKNLSAQYGFDTTELSNSVSNIMYKSEEEIHAAAKIMEACTSYILYKELITSQENRIIEAAKQYIDEHLSEELEITEICKYLQISRTKLYEIFRSELKIGVSKYILHRRMKYAKKLLKTTKLSIPEIANKACFSDYNYFSRVYKKTYGKSPRSYRR